MSGYWSGLRYLSITVIATLALCPSAYAGLSAGSGTYFYSDNIAGQGFGGDSPTNFTRSASANGVTLDTIYGSNYVLDPEPPPGPNFHQSADTSEELQATISGNSPATQLVALTAYSQSTTDLDFSGLQIPGYNEQFYALMSGRLDYHLAAGDTLTYTVEGTIGTTESRLLFDSRFTATTSTPETSLSICPSRRLSSVIWWNSTPEVI